MKIRQSIISFAALSMVAAFSSSNAVAGPDPFGSKFNNYQCYRVADSGGDIKDRSVKVADQFGQYGQYAARLAYVCNPVSIDGEPIAEKEVHLACFQTDPNNNQHLKPQQVLLQNRFGEQKAALEAVSQLLCVTTIKKHL